MKNSHTVSLSPKEAKVIDGIDDGASGPLTHWSLDREVVLTRVVDTSAAVAYSAWTDPSRFAAWFGPDGYSCVVHEMDVRVGGRAAFDMTGADGTVYTNRFEYLEVLPDRRLVFDHGSDVDDDPGRFRVTVTFDQQSNGKSVVTLRQIHPSVEQREAVIGFGAVELGLQTLRKLSEHVEQ